MGSGLGEDPVDRPLFQGLLGKGIGQGIDLFHFREVEDVVSAQSFGLDEKIAFVHVLLNIGPNAEVKGPFEDGEHVREGFHPPDGIDVHADQFVAFPLKGFDGQIANESPVHVYVAFIIFDGLEKNGNGRTRLEGQEKIPFLKDDLFTGTEIGGGYVERFLEIGKIAGIEVFLKDVEKAVHAHEAFSRKAELKVAKELFFLEDLQDIRRFPSCTVEGP